MAKDSAVEAAGHSVIEAAKGLLEIVQSTEGEKVPPRPGPLVVVGRFYVSMTVLTGAIASVAALIDAKTGHEPTGAVTAMRFIAVGACAVGIVLCVILLIYLIKRHHLMIFSPSELSPEAQQRLFGAVTKEEAEQEKIVAPPPEPLAK